MKTKKLITFKGIKGELVKEFENCKVIFQDKNGPRGSYVVVGGGDCPYVGGKKDAMKEAEKRVNKENKQ